MYAYILFKEFIRVATACGLSSPAMAVSWQKGQGPGSFQSRRRNISAVSSAARVPGSTREPLVFSPQWNPEDVCSNTSEGIAQGQDSWTCQGEGGQTGKEEKNSFFPMFFRVGCFLKAWPRFGGGVFWPCQMVDLGLVSHLKWSNQGKSLTDVPRW